MDAITDAVMVLLDSSLKIQAFSAQLPDLSGYSSQELIEMPIDRILPDFRHLIIPEKITQNQWVRIELTNKQGIRIKGRIKLTRLQSQQGEFTQILFKQPSKIRESYLAFQVLQHIPVGLVLLKDNHVFFANTRFAAITGMEGIGEGPVGKGLCELFSLEVTHEIKNLLAKISPGRQVGGKIEINHPEKRLYAIFACPVDLESEKFVLMTFFDPQIVQHRGSNIDPYLSRKDRMRALEKLAGEVAHDFNNMINGVMGYAELLREYVHSEPGIQYIDNIIESAMDASGVAGKLLDFASATKKTNEVFDVNDAVKAALKIIDGRTLSSGLRLISNLHAEKLPVFGDKQAIKQAVLNLLTNAMEASPENGSIDVITSLKKIEGNEGLKPGLYATITVIDQGDGIPEHIREHIFDPFFSTRSKTERSGLGLSIVYTVVKDHSGAIEVESESGKGALFRILLPLHGSHDAKGIVSDGKADSWILVVDDDDSVRALAEKILRSKGFQAIGASSGMDAIEMVGSHADRIALVLLDMVMPGMNGRQCYQELRRIKPDIKVIVMTGYYEDWDVRFADAFISKPFTIDKLLEKIETLLK